MMNCLISENDTLSQKSKLLEKEKEAYFHKIKQQSEEIGYLNDKLVIETQIKAFHEKAAEEAEQFYAERINEFKEQLDRKEYIIQLKENKWNEIEKIMTIYSKNDSVLREQLTQLKYL